MRVLLPFLGILSVASAFTIFTISPPEAGALSEFCTGLTTAASIADTVLLKNRGVPDIRRIDSVDALVDISVKFKQGIEQGALFSRAGSIVVKDFVYSIEHSTTGTMQSEDVKELVGILAGRVSGLLGDAKTIDTFFGDARTAMNQLEYRLSKDEAEILDHIRNIEREIQESGRGRGRGCTDGGSIILLFPLPTLGHIQDAQDSKGLRNLLRQSLDDVRQLKVEVETAKHAAVAQIQYWSQILDQLQSLEATREDWLEDPSSKEMAKTVLPQWMVVLEMYSECSYTVSDAGRHIQGRLQFMG